MKEVIILIKRIIKNYKQSLILILAIIIGTILGLILKNDAKILSPLGDIFINLLYVVIVPLIFLTITTSISKMESPKRLKKLIGTIFLVFIITSLVSVFIGLIATSTTKLVEVDDSAKILETLDKDYQTQDLEVNILERTVQALTVHDFKDLLSKDNILPLIVFSFLFGCSLNMSKEKTKPLIKILESLTTVTMNLIKIISPNRNMLLFCSPNRFIWSIYCSWISKNICNIFNSINIILPNYIHNICIYLKRIYRS